VSDPYIESLTAYLRQGKAEPSCHLVLQLLNRPGARAEDVTQLLGDALNQLLEEFQVGPVVAFLAEMEMYLPAPIVEPVRKKVGGRTAVILDWSKKIGMVGRERQARELRAAIRARNLPATEKWIGVMLGVGLGRDLDRPVAEYIGSVLGSAEHTRREAEQVFVRFRKGTASFKLPIDIIDAMERAFHDRTRKGEVQARSEFREAEFVRELTSLTVELKAWLPGGRVAGNPTEEHIERFHEAVHAIAATVFLSGDLSRWADVTQVLVDYCPRELSIVGRRAGVEERAYMTLTPTARRTVFEAMGRLGRNPVVTGSYLKFAATVEEERLTRYVVEVMGSMHSKAFLPYIQKVVETESQAALRGAAMAAISNYADGASAEILLRALRGIIGRGKRHGIVPEGAERREAVQALFALGRIVRSPRMDAGGRNEIMKRAVVEIPDKDARLQHELAYQFFLTRADGWSAENRAWAVTTLTRSLWLADTTPDFAPGDDRAATALGARAPSVEALVAIGRDAIPAMMRACEDASLRFGGAYTALAEALGQIKDPRGLDLLERLLANSLLIDISDRTKYQTEKYYDSTEGVRKDLTPDQVIAAILFAIERIGGERGDMLLVRAYTQVLGPGGSPAGAETNAFLERVRARLMHEGTWNTLVKGATERRHEPARVNGDGGESERRDPAAALKTLKSMLFWPGKRRPHKIAAMQALASMCNLEAIPLIAGHLKDSDPLVRGSAETALGEYAWAASNEAVMRAMIYSLLDHLRDRDNGVRTAVYNILRRLGPSREPLRSKLLAISQTEPDPLMRAEATRLLDEGEEAPTGVEVLGIVGQPVDTEPQTPFRGEARAPVRQDATPQPQGPTYATDLNELMRLKREYILARQAWIRSGKRGEPPKPPENM
jgi:HEAT repeat protein